MSSKTARSGPLASTFQDFQYFVRYNNYQVDPCQFSDPGRSIAARYDLRVNLGQYKAKSRGCTDSKATSLNLSKDFSFYFVVGPVTNATHNIPEWNFSQHPEKVHP